MAVETTCETFQWQNGIGKATQLLYLLGFIHLTKLNQEPSPVGHGWIAHVPAPKVAHWWSKHLSPPYHPELSQRSLSPGSFQWLPSGSPFSSCLQSILHTAARGILLTHNLVHHTSSLLSSLQQHPILSVENPKSYKVLRDVALGYLSYLISYHSLQCSLLSSHPASLLFPKQVQDLPITKPSTCCSFCLEYSFPRCSWLVSFTSLGFLLNIHLFREAVPDQFNNLKWYPSLSIPFSCFNFVHSIYYLPPAYKHFHSSASRPYSPSEN